MTELLSFFETMPSWQKLAWIVFVISACWLLEALIPLRHLAYKKWRHARTNIGFLALTLLINLIFGVVVLFADQWAQTHQFGLLYIVTLPTWASLMGAVLLLDLVAQYGAHYLLHKVPFLFRFHRVHHSDTAVDVTTGTRLHPGDYLVRELLSLALIIVAGIPLSYYLIYRFITILFTYINHANIALPSRLEQTLAWLIITPNLHKTHHHNEVHWTDSNYGNIFSIWDRLFGTLVINDVNDVVYGLDIVDDQYCDDFLYQLQLPFKNTLAANTKST